MATRPGGEGGKEGAAPGGLEVAKGGLLCSASPGRAAAPRPRAFLAPFPNLACRRRVIFKKKLNVKKSLYLGLQVES